MLRPLFLRPTLRLTRAKVRGFARTDDASDRANLDEMITKVTQDSAELKEKMIFDSILDSVLTRSSDDRQPHKPLTSTVQAFFNKPDKVATDEALRTVGDREPADHLRSMLTPILEHLSALDSNRDVLKYFYGQIVARFGTTEPLKNIRINSDNISYLTKHTIDMLWRDFKDPMAALQVFRHAKQQPTTYFTAACSGEVYNSILELSWNCYRDLSEIRGLVNEIFINAVKFNTQTVELLGKIGREALDGSQNLASAEEIPLWTAREDKAVRTLNKYRMHMMSVLASQADLKPVNIFV